jgi:hypothetical protein
VSQLRGENIIIISNEGWGTIWYSKHNYANELSKANNVFFVNPPSRWKIKNIFQPKIQKQQITETLHVITYTNVLPTSFFYRLNNYIVSRKIRAFLKKRNIKDFLLWTFDPYRLTNPKTLGARTCILHLVDKYYDTYPGEKQIKKKISAIIAVSNKVLYPDLDKVPTLIVPHGIAESEFNADTEQVELIRKKHGDVFGLYVGMIDFRMDFQALETILISRPNLPFVFVGLDRGAKPETYRRIFLEKQYSNCIQIGPKPFYELKNYIAASTFCMAPMDITISGNEISHHKIFQYLAMGKPVVCPSFTEYNSISHLFRICKNSDDYVKEITHILKEPEPADIVAERIEHAKKHAFPVHLKTISRFIEQIRQGDTRS